MIDLEIGARLAAWLWGVLGLAAVIGWWNFRTRR